MSSAALKSQPHDEALGRQRRRQIFLAACRVLTRNSFHEAPVKEIALEAGLAAGSIYVYLESKDEILVLLAESMVGELVDQLPALHERYGDDPRRELAAIMREILDIGDRYLSAVAEVVERGRKLGVIHADDVPAAVHAIHMLCAGWAMGAHGLRHSDKESYWREISRIVEGRFLAPHLELKSNSDKRREES